MKLTMQMLEELAVDIKKKRKDIFIEVAAPYVKNKVFMYHHNQLDKMFKFFKENFNDNLENKVDPKIKVVGIRVW